MDVVWFWFWVLLLFLVIATWPTWPYTRERWPYTRGGGYRYGPSAAAAFVALLILLFFWLGLIAIAWPWAAAPVAVE